MTVNCLFYSFFPQHCEGEQGGNRPKNGPEKHPKKSPQTGLTRQTQGKAPENAIAALIGAFTAILGRIQKAKKQPL